MRGGFADEIAGVEFLEGGVDVFEVERNMAWHTVVDVGLDDAEQFGEERLGLLVKAETRKRLKRGDRRESR